MLLPEIEDLKQPGRGVEGVVTTQPAVAKENVAAEFAAQRRVQFRGPGADVRMAGAMHHGSAAVAADQVAEPPAGFDVVHNVGAGMGGEDVARENHHQFVRPDDAAAGADHHQAVAVAVQGDPQVGLGGGHHLA